ncbi:MAG: CHAT domain-containing protein [Acidobacteria bacterium]|nr:CHAT domain-containing protein [Acidobacteriota bacterium]
MRRRLIHRGFGYIFDHLPARRCLRFFQRKAAPVYTRAATHFLPFALLGVFALLPAPTAPAGRQVVKAASEDKAAAAPDDVLVPGRAVEAEVPAGRTYECSVDAGSGSFARVVVEASVGEAELSLRAPDGTEVVDLPCRRGEPTPLSFVAEGAGRYRLSVRAADGARVSVRLDELHRAGEADARRVAAERAYAEAERLRLVWKTEARLGAVEKYEGALALWREVRDFGEEAGVLNQLGEVYFALGKPRRALDYFDEALRLGRSLGDKRREVAALNNLAYAHLSLGAPSKAAAYSSKALSLSRRSGNHRGEALALNNLGEVRYSGGELKEALALYEQALALWREEGDRRGQAQTLYYMGSAHTDLSESAQAAAAYDAALSLYRASGDQRGQALTLTAAGNLHSAQGEKQLALDNYYAAKSLFEPSCDPIEEARLLNGIGFVHDELGEKGRALEFYEQALALFRSVSYRRGEATSLLNLGEMNHALGDQAKALDYCRQARTIFRELDDRRTEMFALKDIGLIYDGLGESGSALAYLRGALRLARAGSDKREEANVLGRIGALLEKQGDAAGAMSHYDRALRLHREVKDPFGECTTLYNMARAERARGRLDDARAHFEASLSLVENLRTKVASQELRTSYVASIYQQYEAYIDLLMELHRLRPAAGFDAAALEASERARARTLLETISEAKADIRKGVDPALLGRERELQQALDRKAEQQMQVLSARHTAKEAAAAAAEVDGVVAEYNEVRARIRSESPHYAALTQPLTLGLGQIQKEALDDDTLLLEFSLGNDRSYLWAVTSHEISSYELPGRAEIESAARGLYETLTAPQPRPGEAPESLRERVAQSQTQFPERAALLSHMLLGGVVPRLGRRRLLIVPDGALQYVPFQALPEPGAAPPGDPADAASRPPLVLGHEIVYAPSVSVLSLIQKEQGRRARPPNEVAVLADPVFESRDPRVAQVGNALTDEAPAQTRDLVRSLRDYAAAEGEGPLLRLPASKTEAESIVSLAPSGSGLLAVGFQASRETALSPALGDYRIVHFASHSVFNSEHQELSGIVLSLVDKQGRPQDGFLRLYDIYNLNLSADLVVLSACNTGLGTDFRGEGFVGLTRGFMYAGAGGVLASLWKVDDEATAELMKSFYAGVLREGLSPAAALRRAQMSLRERKRWRAPYYWAGFVLQGDYHDHGRLPSAEPGPRGAALAALAGLFVVAASLGGFYTVRRRRRAAS